jgi:trans-aconitate methyltransferase
LLYETILQLNPHNLIEFGCGGGDHLYNISILNPNIQLSGIDISYKQINLVRERHPTLKAKMATGDITTQLDHYPQVDIAFTQAVLMHIKTDAAYLNGIINLFKCATKQVILMENWTTHDFMGDIQQLFNENKLGWESIHFYYRVSPEYNRPHIMVISKIPIPYSKLLTYNILLNINCDEEQRTVDNQQNGSDKLKHG